MVCYSANVTAAPYFCTPQTSLKLPLKTEYTCYSDNPLASIKVVHIPTSGIQSGAPKHLFSLFASE